MNCPYCAKEMTETTIHSGQPIRWTRSTTKSLGTPDMGADDRFLAGGVRMFGYTVPCSTCLDCGKIIVDLPAATAP